jgi:hypothetical protein
MSDGARSQAEAKIGLSKKIEALEKEQLGFSF